MIVRKTTALEISEYWDVRLIYRTGEQLYVCCNPTGKVNWSNCIVFSEGEIKKRKIEIIEYEKGR